MERRTEIFPLSEHHRLAMAQRRGFNLIELLVVIAIIAILALIAIPNYLDAQVRARIAKARGDMKAMEVALESYLGDYSVYPYGTGQIHGAVHLTTPIAYMVILPTDPFLQYGEQGLYAYHPYYFYVSSRPQGFDHIPGSRFTYRQIIRDFQVNTLQSGPTSLLPHADTPCPALWQIRSFGPWKRFNYCLPYDPTNGLRSMGDIALFGPANPGRF